MRIGQAVFSIAVLAALSACVRLADFTPSCRYDSDCGTGEKCSRTFASSEDTGTCLAPGSLFPCSATKKCPDSSDECVIPAEKTDGVCHSSLYCDSATPCGSGKCILVAGKKYGECKSASYCDTADDCTNGATCVSNACTAKTCGGDADCFPNVCGFNKKCATSCSFGSSCHPDARCDSDTGKCIDNTCSARDASRCGDYRCETAAGHCYEKCRESTQCAVGFGCDTSDSFDGRCMPTCTARDTTACNGYGCNTSNNVCESRCGGSTPCGEGYVCRSLKCVPACTTDATCNGYRCVQSECTTTCSKDSDCSTGNRCASGKCTR